MTESRGEEDEGATTSGLKEARLRIAASGSDGCSAAGLRGVADEDRRRVTVGCGNDTVVAGGRQRGRERHNEEKQRW